MTANLIGTWDGTLLFPTVVLYALRILIENQSSEEKVAGAISHTFVSNLTGYLQTGGWDAKGQVAYSNKIPVVGFVDDTGAVQLSSYKTNPESSLSVSVYAGRLTTRQVALTVISGKAGTSRFVGDSFGTLDPGPPTFTVKRREWVLGIGALTRIYPF